VLQGLQKQAVSEQGLEIREAHKVKTSENGTPLKDQDKGVKKRDHDKGTKQQTLWQQEHKG
jgi:hypothetical protein